MLVLQKGGDNVAFTVKQARTFAGKTQREMAEAIGVCRDTYMHLEKNPERITVGQANAISQYTGIPFNQISFA